MKTGSGKKSSRLPRRSKSAAGKIVRFTYTDPVARQVCVAGTFNEWQPEKSQMVSPGNGHWFTELRLKPGIYEYRLVVDGRWLPDPKADHAKLNCYGEKNSLVAVPDRASKKPRP